MPTDFLLEIAAQKNTSLELFALRNYVQYKEIRSLAKLRSFAQSIDAYFLDHVGRHKLAESIKISNQIPSCPYGW